MTYAINQAQNGRLTNGQIVLVNLGAGTYNETVNLRGPSSNRAVATHDNIGLINTDNNMVVVQGAGSSLTVWNGSTGVCGTVIVENAAVIGIARVTVKGTNNVCQSSLFAQISGVINVYGNDVVFDSASVEQIHVENLGQVEIWGNIYLTGTSQRFIGGGSNGTVIYSAFPSGVITTVGSPIYTREFVFLQTGAEAQFNLGTSFAGTGVIGKRFTVLRGAELLDSGNSLTFLPGTIAGEQSQGGIYVGPVNNYSVNARAGGTLSIVGGWPTSCSGLASGTLWNNGGVINVCP